MTMSEGLNRVTKKMENLGLVILKDENGEYVARGNRNIKINGENMKPLLAKAVEALPDVTVEYYRLYRRRRSDLRCGRLLNRGQYRIRDQSQKGTLCYRWCSRFIQTKQSGIFTS